MERVMCEMCGKEERKEERIWRVFDHWICSDCSDKIRDYIDTTVDIAEQERKRSNRLEFDDVAEFCKVKEGKKDVIRTSKAYLVGDVIEIYYDGFAYKDSVKCKVIGSHKAASDGYIVELINI